MRIECDDNTLYKGNRNSNVELLRIVAMLAIIAHHYVVNSTVSNLFDPVHPTSNSIFLLLWGMWGKTSINIFVLITGYFMCNKTLTVKRYMKMLLEIIFYSWILWGVLAIFDYETLSWRGALNRLLLLDITANQNGGFVPGFMWMYLMIPFLNVYIKTASRENYIMFVLLLLVMFSFCGTFLFANVYHHVFWYMTLYLIGAFIRKYPFVWMGNLRICLFTLISLIILGWFSVLGIVWLSAKLGRSVLDPYLFVADSHKILAVGVSVSAFLTFINLKIPQSRSINTVASTTFGVLLIHAATDGMRKWLWQDFINVPAAYSSDLGWLVCYSIIVVLGVLGTCSVLDYLRIRLVEEPFFNTLEKYLKDRELKR